jgi:hypothetical protein
MEPVTVHCPNCHVQVTVKPTVRSVVLDGPSITVNFNTGTASHHCGAPPMRTGFAAPSKGGTP